MKKVVRQNNVLKTVITTNIGMSIQLASGDWIKSSHTVSSESVGYPSPDKYREMTERQLDDATSSCKEQIAVLEKRVTTCSSES